MSERPVDDLLAEHRGELRGDSSPVIRAPAMIGFSDTPAWKVAQAQMLAQFHGWAPLVALADRVFPARADG